MSGSQEANIFDVGAAEVEFATLELPALTSMVFRGREIKVCTDLDHPQGLHLPVALALLSLEDPRVDEVFRAFGLTIMDADGVRVWPPEEEG